jgi:hypothetical protein
MNTWFDIARDVGITVKTENESDKVLTNSLHSLLTLPGFFDQKQPIIKKKIKLVCAREALNEFCITCPDANRSDGFRRKDAAGMFKKYGLQPSDSVVSFVLSEACKRGKLVTSGAGSSARYTLLNKDI